MQPDVVSQPTLSVIPATAQVSFSPPSSTQNRGTRVPGTSGFDSSRLPPPRPLRTSSGGRKPESNSVFSPPAVTIPSITPLTTTGIPRPIGASPSYPFAPIPSILGLHPNQGREGRAVTNSPGERAMSRNLQSLPELKRALALYAETVCSHYLSGRREIRSLLARRRYRRQPRPLHVRRPRRRLRRPVVGSCPGHPRRSARHHRPPRRHLRPCLPGRPRAHRHGAGAGAARARR